MLFLRATTMLLQPEALRAIAGTTYIGTNAKAKRELGYDPRSMEDGFKEMLEYEMKVRYLLVTHIAMPKNSFVLCESRDPYIIVLFGMGSFCLVAFDWPRVSTSPILMTCEMQVLNIKN